MEGEISIEFVATLTQSLINFHEKERSKKKKAAQNEKERGDMAHIKLCEHGKKLEKNGIK